MPLGRVRTRTTVAKADSSVVGVLKVEDGIVRNMGTGGREEPVDDLSGVLKKEVTNPRKDTPFVVLPGLGADRHGRPRGQSERGSRGPVHRPRRDAARECDRRILPGREADLLVEASPRP